MDEHSHIHHYRRMGRNMVIFLSAGGMGKDVQSYPSLQEGWAELYSHISHCRRDGQSCTVISLTTEGMGRVVQSYFSLHEGWAELYSDISHYRRDGQSCTVIFLTA